MSDRKTPQEYVQRWVVVLAAALLIAWVVTGLLDGWKVYHVLGVVAMSFLLVQFLRHNQRVRRNRLPGDHLKGANEPAD